MAVLGLGLGPMLVAASHSLSRRSPPGPTLPSFLISSTITRDAPSVLKSGLASILEVAKETATVLRHTCEGGSKATTENASGDTQLNLDLQTDALAFSTFSSNPAIHSCISEETPVHTPLTSTGTLTISFDPLDGSSIIGPNFTIGGIYTIWPSTDSLISKKGTSALASVIIMYGSRTTAFISCVGKGCMEVTLTNGKWLVTTEKVILKPTKKIFAPGNLRCVNTNPSYKKIVDHWINENYTLRYTGGMVPDICHIMSKEGGVFSNVSSDKNKQKLRFIYEVTGMAIMVEEAGGVYLDESLNRALERKVEDVDMRVGGVCGSTGEVEIFKKIFQS
ncbi:hypothetical protein TrLO_g6256 [Triparma laevis f. longispina]|uniref:Fructose-bisphosphatase n=1 Tax=Triparma laevis f. longispina TaxID=1714387 RepID=A0A9W7AWF5_9STRA|nr:hypothetical protein TrLO_g6256 [Triparma laevis f. longispina]